jgi:hypothetical protein
MNDCCETESKKKSAKYISTFVFLFSCVVSAVVYFTQDKLNVFDYALILFSPFALSIFFYFVVLHHDPNASD